MGRIVSKLKPMIDERGSSIRQVAKDIDYRFESVRQMYNNDSRQFPRDLLVKLCAYFGCTVADLLVYEEESPQD